MTLVVHTRAGGIGRATTFSIAHTHLLLVIFQGRVASEKLHASNSCAVFALMHRGGASEMFIEPGYELFEQDLQLRQFYESSRAGSVVRRHRHTRAHGDDVVQSRNSLAVSKSSHILTCD